MRNPKIKLSKMDNIITTYKNSFSTKALLSKWILRFDDKRVSFQKKFREEMGGQTFKDLKSALGT